MRVLTPETIDSTKLTASNIATDDADEWAGGTTYDAGDQVVVLGTTNKVYESVAGSNVGNNPTTVGQTAWLEVSAINRYRAFDNELKTVTTGGETITYTLEPARYVSAVSFFLVTAISVRVVVKDGTAATQHDVTVELFDDRSIRTFTDYYDPIPVRTNAIIDTIAVLPGWTIEITIDAGTGGTASVGMIQAGRKLDIGKSTYNVQPSFRDFSRVRFDEFGTVEITRRAASRNMTLEVAVPTTGVGSIMDELGNLRGRIATIWTHDEFADLGTGIVGIIRNFRPSYTAASTSFLTVEIEGVT